MVHTDNEREPLPDPLPRGFPLGRYMIMEELAPAGMGRVYRAEDTALCQAVAINVLSVALRDDVGWYKFLMRFRRAAKAHQGSVRAFGVHLGVPYAVVAYADDSGAAIDIAQE